MSPRKLVPKCTVRGCNVREFSAGLCHKHATKRADDLFSLWVRRGGVCERCGKTERLQCAHGFPRSYRPVRWTVGNAWCLCAGCHTYFTKQQRVIEWDDWMRERMGDVGSSFYEYVRRKAVHGDARQELELALDWLLQEGLERAELSDREADG